MYFLMTVDVEAFSIPLNREDPGIVSQVHQEGLPLMLALFSKYDVKGTFYFTGTFAEQSPESVELVREHGHEVGCHGYDHSPLRAFDVLSYEEQVSDLLKAKNVIEDAAGRIEAFRAPALRINEDTVRALEETGFKTDSSICSQRFDGPFTFGSRKKLKWLFASRRPYMLSYDSLTTPGRSKVLEVPISAFVLPYIGTMMRITPWMTKNLQKVLFFESRRTGKPLVFLFHPNECITVNGGVTTERRASNYFGYLFADLLRQRLKLRNLGRRSLRLLDDVLGRASQHELEFISVGDYRRNRV
ncbi:MAG: polysaccharide deacetylase family protein [Archaeoglobaceae archaeon]